MQANMSHLVYHSEASQTLNSLLRKIFACMTLGETQKPCTSVTLNNREYMRHLLDELKNRAPYLDAFVPKHHNPEK
jgi:hypothetical protein